MSEPTTTKNRETYRDYGASVRPGVTDAYRANHRHQTLELVARKAREFAPGRHGRMGIWEAIERLDEVVDDSDPDTQLSQMQHLLQTAEAIRRDGHPPWFVLAGLVHDLGKTLCLHGEPQWAVVGDTFPVGCRFSRSIVFPDLFADNPDASCPDLMTELGIYERGCGLDRVHLSWGHDEYMYQVARPYLPPEALAMVRYHSFYAWHREGGYQHLMNRQDHAALKWVRKFNRYDLYSKGGPEIPVSKVRPYYQSLIGEYFPDELDW